MTDEVIAVIDLTHENGKSIQIDLKEGNLIDLFEMLSCQVKVKIYFAKVSVEARFVND